MWHFCDRPLQFWLWCGTEERRQWMLGKASWEFKVFLLFQGFLLPCVYATLTHFRFRYYKIDPNTGDAVRVDRGCKLIEGAEYDVQVRLISSLQERRTAKASVVFRFCLSATSTLQWMGDSSEKFTLAEVLQIPGRCARCMHSVKSHTFFN